MAERIQVDTGLTGAEAPVEEVTEPTTERPEWLPEKFESAEDMAKAYGELESKLGGKSEAPDSEDEDEHDDEDTKTEETAVAGINTEAMEEFSNEFYEKGDLSEESLDRIETEFGISKDIAKAYVDGQKALVEQAQQSIFEEVGGRESYEAMISWAKENLEESEVKSYDAAIISNDMDTAKMVAKGLHAQYFHAVGGAAPKLASGSASATGGGEGYGSWQQVSADMRKPEYREDSAFRQKVKNRLAVSKL